MLFDSVLPSEFTFQRIWPIALASVVLAYLIQNVRSYWRLRHFPGPWLAAWTSLWNLRVEMSGHNYLEWAKACDKYGRWNLRIVENIISFLMQVLSYELLPIYSLYMMRRLFAI